MKEQTAQMALSAQREAEAAAAKREAAEARLAETQLALEAEQNNVKSVEVSSQAKCNANVCDQTTRETPLHSITSKNECQDMWVYRVSCSA